MEEKPTTPTKTNLSTPIAIVIAGLMIAGAVYYRDTNPPTPTVDPTPATENKLEAVRPIDPKTDHIRGSVDAPIKIVEYSDLECPFCKKFHNSMEEIFAKYGESGEVAWVYRHFPIDSLHAKARPEAIATECAALLGGNDIFWAYTDKIFEITPANDGLDLNLLPQIAVDLGLDEAEFNTCLKDQAIADKVEADLQNAVDAGGRGTPFPIFIDADGNKTALPGAVPASYIEELIKQSK